MAIPHLTFFCELESDALQTLFHEPTIFESLLELKATVSLGLLDFSPERAAVVRQLSREGVPVVAWLLLPKDQGYWFNTDNWRQATARYADFKRWTAEEDLEWAGVGLDIEPDFNEMQLLMRGQAWQLAPKTVKQVFDGERVRRAQVAYAMLMAQIHADGYPVESYQFSNIVDERWAGSTLLQRFFSLVDVPSDREVLMLYSSFLGGLGAGNLWVYGPDAGGIGVGITGGGTEGTDVFALLSWDELARDLRLARHWSNHIYIFSLEGCVRQEFLARLVTFDWDGPVTLPLETARKLGWTRKALRGLLWASAHPGIVVGGLLGAAWLGSRLRPAGKE